MSITSQRDLVVVHSSDLHLGTDSMFGSHGSDRLVILKSVLEAAAAKGADVVVLAGDTFDHNRQPADLIERTAKILDDYGAPVVILPGNHDPLTPDSVYRRAEFVIPANVHVLGLTAGEIVEFPELGLEIWGRAHMDYCDMAPLREPRPRSLPWRLAAAHGHYVDEPEEPGRLLGSWLIRREQLIAVDAHYVALGHWNRAARVSDEAVNAYYSGAPDFTGTVNLVCFRPGGVEVTHAPVACASAAMIGRECF
ncbi:MAG TPA: metallophosphoesterase [Candidatus Acidoferrales bacterium]|nr:metallophosphoesterase [Candidatus Acidoferrales bacterium]